MKKEKNRDTLEPYNWIDVLIRFAQISGTFAGFCITFIVLTIGGKVADVQIWSIGVTYGQISVFLFGTSAALFIFASQRFLRAQEHNLWRLPVEYKEAIMKDGSFTDSQWEELLLSSDKKCREYEKEGRWTYDGASLVMILGLFFAIASYNSGVALFVLIIGVVLEALQIFK